MLSFLLISAELFQMQHQRSSVQQCIERRTTGEHQGQACLLLRPSLSLSLAGALSVCLYVCIFCPYRSAHVLYTQGRRSGVRVHAGHVAVSLGPPASEGARCNAGPLCQRRGLSAKVQEEEEGSRICRADRGWYAPRWFH
jgi:hypothetical protein